MNIIEFKNVSKSFFTQNLYKNVDLEINSDEKIALVGNNGTGKSTFIKLIMDEQSPDRGKVIRNEDAIISCFDQFGKIDLNKKVEDLLNSPFEEVIAVQKELESVSSQFSDNSEENEKLLEKYAELSDRFESLGGYSYLHVQSEFIDIFELTDKLNKTFKELSGGEKQYIRLAITLFSHSDLIILDEPLSFFDKKKTAWLSNYILESTKAFLVISHNVDFIRSFANKIFDIDNMRIGSYECNYPNYLKEKKIRLAEEKKQNQETESVIETTEEAIEKKLKLLERCNNKHAHAVILRRMRKELQRLQKEKIKFSPEYQYEYSAPPKAVFISSREIDGPIATLTNVSKEYPDKLLYKDANLEIEKDTKICIVGENGSGKSTLLKIIAGLEEPTSGEVVINKDAKISFIEQDTIFENEKISVKDYLKEKTGLSDDFIEAAIDNLYNNELEFRDKRIFMLSGGEKKRLEIFTNTLLETDLLIIDEPSTYMDDYSRDTIANMLLDYPGAVILVSHDKVLLRKIKFTTYDIRDKRFRIKE
ncbi:MAG: ATP-binding cassette domain-containing protein [Cetobacterium sp.]|uniref:ABC-F family ATP-binding cassette domain-containing protein n=1 Tax=Cetobacterium sp. TaxID=2071632 RepID=UPI002FCBED17